MGGSVGVMADESGRDESEAVCETGCEEDALILAESCRISAAFDFTFEINKRGEVAQKGVGGTRRKIKVNEDNKQKRTDVGRKN